MAVRSPNSSSSVATVCRTSWSRSVGCLALRRASSYAWPMPWYAEPPSGASKTSAEASSFRGGRSARISSVSGTSRGPVFEILRAIRSRLTSDQHRLQTSPYRILVSRMSRTEVRGGADVDRKSGEREPRLNKPVVLGDRRERSNSYERSFRLVVTALSR